MKTLAVNPPLIGHDGKPISALTFPAYALARAYLSHDRMGRVAQNIARIASLCDIVEEDAARLPGTVYRKASKIARELMEADQKALVEHGLPTGEEDALSLIHPLVFGVITIPKLVMRRDTIASDYLAFDQSGGVAQNMALIASLTGQDQVVIEKLSGVDYRRAVIMAGHRIAADEEPETEAGDGDGAADSPAKKKPEES